MPLEGVVALLGRVLEASVLVTIGKEGNCNANQGNYARYETDSYVDRVAGRDPSSVE